jgi:hypothetical protein
VGGFIGWILLVVMSGGEDISAVSYGIMFGLVAVGLGRIVAL